MFGSPPVHRLHHIQVNDIQTSTSNGISLAASPSTVNNGDYVTVSFSGITDPAPTDWVALYLTSDTNISAVAPVKYSNATNSAGYLSTGSGSLQFRLVNMRSDYKFVFFRNGFTTPIAVAESNVVVLQSPVCWQHPSQQ